MARGDKSKESKGKKPQDKNKGAAVEADANTPAYKKGGTVHAGIPKGKK